MRALQRCSLGSSSPAVAPADAGAAHADADDEAFASSGEEPDVPDEKVALMEIFEGGY